ncbi:MAG: hypothetical protein M1300_07495 [Epsilonproteobacteria bacterium]|nr:hypothetical protein [Campylobacterota bacterium]
MWTAVGGSGGTIKYSDWSSAYGGKWSIKVYKDPSSYIRLYYEGITNTINSYQYLANGTLIGTSAPQFNCANLEATSTGALIKGYCEQAGVSIWGNDVSAQVTPAGVTVYNGVSKLYLQYPWGN